jgi:hypothetical protein
MEQETELIAEDPSDGVIINNGKWLDPTGYAVAANICHSWELD